MDKRKTLGKCHPLCQTCDSQPIFKGESLQMNCKTCKLNIPNWPGLTLGFCPGIIDYESFEREEENIEEEEEIEINYNCPVDKPISKDGECVLDYCTVEDFRDGTCYFSNFYIRRQWMNNFHLFSYGFNSGLSVNINEKGDVFLSVKKETDHDNYFYLYGIHSNGTSIFYDRMNDKYYN